MDDFSSDSDDIPLALRVNGRRAPQASQATSEEPDWVRSHAPVKKEERNESDSDSVLNILSGDDAGVGSQASQVVDVNASQEQKAPKKRKALRKGAAPKSELKLVMAGRLEEGLTLLQADGADLDLSGDVGAVGRVKLEAGEALLDIKGTLYKALPYACNTTCVMAVTDTEARISAVLGEAVALGAVDNVFAAEHDGALDGHNFEYEEDMKMKADGSGKRVGKSSSVKR